MLGVTGLRFSTPPLLYVVDILQIKLTTEVANPSSHRGEVYEHHLDGFSCTCVIRKSMSSETKENYYDDVSQVEITTKESRGSVFRRKYDFWPSFYQHSLHPKEVTDAFKTSYCSELNDE